MKWNTKALVLAAALVPAACGDGEFTAGPATAEIAGEYMAASGRGRFLFSTDEQTWDLTAEGSVVQLQIFANGTTAGRIFIPAEDETAHTYEADLTGRWMMQGNTIYFMQEQQNILGNMEFQLVGSELRAERQFVDGTVRLTLVK